MNSRLHDRKVYIISNILQNAGSTLIKELTNGRELASKRAAIGEAYAQAY